MIALRPTPEAYREYGALLNQLGETEAAAEAFKDGLGMVSSASDSDVLQLEHSS